MQKQRYGNRHWRFLLHLFVHSGDMENEKKNAFEAYNIIADWYAANRYQGIMEKAWLDSLINLTGKGAKVLDLGCRNHRIYFPYR